MSVKAEANDSQHMSEGRSALVEYHASHYCRDHNGHGKFVIPSDQGADAALQSRWSQFGMKGANN